MTISLNGIVLDDSMILEERYESLGVEQSVRRTLGGSAVVFSGSLGKGSPITLLATANFGWLTKAQADSVLAIAAVAGGIYTLIYGALTESVIFRHDEAPAVDLQPLLARQTQLDTDYFTGAIKLLTV
jgi:hypothetical protein